MQRTILEYDEKTGLAAMRALVDSDETDAFNADERRRIGRGFTQGGTMRQLANINILEYNALLMNMDRDALDFEASGMRDMRALRRLLVRFPAWRCSEGGI